jgi:hypothetical protein
MCISLTSKLGIRLHYAYFITHPDHQAIRSLSAFASKWASVEKEKASPPRANAAFVILVRNEEIVPLIETLKQLEDRFNRQYHYPYVFLNDQPFDEDFKR